MQEPSRKSASSTTADIVIQPEMARAIQRGLANACRYFHDVETRPQLVVPIERSGALLVPALHRVLTKYNLETTFSATGIVLDRDWPAGYARYDALAAIGGKHEVRWPTTATLDALQKWMDTSPRAEAITAQLNFLLGTHDTPSRVAFLDDTVQHGRTLVVLAAILRRLNRPIVIHTNAGQHLQAVLDEIMRESAAIPGAPCTVTLLTISRESDWLVSTVLATFSHDLPSLLAIPDDQELLVAEMLVGLAKGKIKTNGTLRPVDAEDLNMFPAWFRDRHSDSELLSLSSRVTARLAELGEATTLSNFGSR